MDANLAANALCLPPPVLNCRGQVLDLAAGSVVMGILNLTPDSFSDGGRYMALDDALRQAERLLAEGATILDLGGMSSRPGAALLSPQEEVDRVAPVLERLCAAWPHALLSLDVFRAPVAEPLLRIGGHIVNDIGGGVLDSDLPALAAHYRTPYVLMHMQGTPQTMQRNPQYANDDPVADVRAFFIRQITALRQAGVVDIILDPGFGFGKTVAHNYRLLSALPQFVRWGLPVLVGVSRKSMITRLLDIKPADALPATTALHLYALQQGAHIVRAHDVAEARQAIRLYEAIKEAITIA